MAKAPRDGIEKYLEFHRLEPKSITKSNLRLPERAHLLGDASFVQYRSDKWEDKPHNYHHDHEAGTRLYVPNGRGDVEVPRDILEAESLVLLGKCIGLGYRIPGESYDTDHNTEPEIRAPWPDLYCTPTGKSLLIIQGKRTVKALIWGGFLDVRAAGIVC